MENYKMAEKMSNVHSDIRGPLFVEAMKMQEEGIPVLKLNTGNPAAFWFGGTENNKNTQNRQMGEGVGFFDF